ncbi:lytic murein transglycosylase [Mesorhizobium sp. M2D.F.Ca.ET.185.01.1.1]|nr:lytic murein transglycosylase [Mesorhizobium sp. M2D.F.Ca.ET.140.01.1.1]TGP19291.1 lytic murein transglycosylase [Mesorhizobium sp. M2D.F.Ca.ET.233.01.1.1]TGP27993.1 lytic murein transglycosylase [Mesorhizobium sp. M2D.F.Ca.ET.232.01.1.1]TGP52017.1 lytic murein transglycosylase [Mesorhizobium sp. M2D.F.Ca.ET.226.01.1.1]TGP54140.1 lytic murein transglycosylase [bacterium M00.F.Ca.ET.230.01.1.1]TGP60822.1 lytic murein transglycosylase [Mesorhizobium sp. M2D.F.Ca.ET.225.01.1.1]TGP79537.1 lyti
MEMLAPGTPLWPAGHLPRKGGDQLSSRPSLISNAAELGEAPKLPISPLAGEMSGRTEGGAWAPSYQPKTRTAA